MSTVGYGDQFPITNPGRVLGTVIIVVGVGIFGTLTGYLANLFLSPGAQEKAAHRPRGQAAGAEGPLRAASRPRSTSSRASSTGSSGRYTYSCRRSQRMATDPHSGGR